MNRNTITLTLLTICLLGAFMWVSVTGSAHNQKDVKDDRGVCALDAMQCSDGSWVGRSGTDCRFVCPVGTSSQPVNSDVLLETSIGKEVVGLGVKILPTKVLEDSRCPLHVQCIQAGTVRVRTTLISESGTSTVIFTLGTTITTEAENVTLVSVTPTREAGKNISVGGYRFTFKIVKR